MQNNFYGNGNTQQNSADENLVRQDIIGELEAINQYSNHIATTNNSLVKKTLNSIKLEEEVHVGELMALLFTLSPESRTQFEKGVNEFSDGNK